MNPYDFHRRHHPLADLKNLMECPACVQEFDTCREKRQYATLEKAEQKAAHLNSLPQRALCLPYQCPMCDQWHLTHAAGKGRRSEALALIEKWARPKTVDA